MVQEHPDELFAHHAVPQPERPAALERGGEAVDGKVKFWQVSPMFVRACPVLGLAAGTIVGKAPRAGDEVRHAFALQVPGLVPLAREDAEARLVVEGDRKLPTIERDPRHTAAEQPQEGSERGRDTGSDLVINPVGVSERDRRLDHEVRVHALVAVGAVDEQQADPVVESDPADLAADQGAEVIEIHALIVPETRARRLLHHV